MNCYQHVYGRVSRGYDKGSPGYQVAALSPELENMGAVLETANKYSFFDSKPGMEKPARYSFFRPGQGYLAFGCARYAEDLSGAVGTFAHNLVFQEEEFIAETLSPVAVLSAFAFFQSEAELPAGRSLPPLALDPKAQGDPKDEWFPLALTLLDQSLDDSKLSIPCVVARDESAWEILGALFALLPRLEASRLTFSTMFLGTSGFPVEGYRVLFTPEASYAPSGKSLFRVIVPSHASAPPQDPNPFARFWLDHRKRGKELLDFIHALRHRPERLPELKAAFTNLLECGPAFRTCVKFLNLPAFDRLLFSEAAWIVSYYGDGELLDYPMFSGLLWEAPEQYLRPLLAALGRLNQEDLRNELLTELALRLADGSVGANAVGTVRETGCLDPFYRMLSSRRNDIPLLKKLAFRLKDEPACGLFIHELVAGEVLRNLTSYGEEALEQLSDWTGQHLDPLFVPPFLKCYRDFLKWIRGRGRGDEFSVNGRDLTRDQYNLILGGAWQLWSAGVIDRAGGEFLPALLHGSYRPLFFNFLASHFPHVPFPMQREIAGALLKFPDITLPEYRLMLNAVRESENAHAVAKYIIKKANEIDKFDEKVLNELKKIKNDTGFWR